MSAASSSSHLPASLELYNYIVFTTPYCLASGYPCNYQISSHVKSLLLVFPSKMLNIRLVAESWRWHMKQPGIEWSQMQEGLISLFIRTWAGAEETLTHFEDLLEREPHRSPILQHGSPLS
ncbi:hypothetical protein HJG60_010677 [Phyllostomus discolor]|uniref:Uncharacterized protein n=1 Tax=Phyllostomus discolor TaxID=89673 RepID=A0A834ANN7_9CHIR|nr:hypothetical protein HJG60_010677 [Phyllostomus discolor]